MPHTICDTSAHHVASQTLCATLRRTLSRATHYLRHFSAPWRVPHTICDTSAHDVASQITPNPRIASFPIRIALTIASRTSPNEWFSNRKRFAEETLFGTFFAIFKKPKFPYWKDAHAENLLRAHECIVNYNTLWLRHHECIVNYSVLLTSKHANRFYL